MPRGVYKQALGVIGPEMAAQKRGWLDLFDWLGIGAGEVGRRLGVFLFMSRRHKSQS